MSDIPVLGGTNEDIHTVCMFACIYTVQCTCLYKQTHSVYSGLSVLTWNVISASDSHNCT